MKYVILAYKDFFNELTAIYMQDSQIGKGFIISKDNDWRFNIDNPYFNSFDFYTAVSKNGFNWLIDPKFDLDGNVLNSIVIDDHLIHPTVEVIESMLTENLLPAINEEVIIDRLIERGIVFGDTIRSIRSRLNLSLKAFAEKLNTEVNIIDDIENAKESEPNPSLLRNISEIFQFSMDKLLEMAGIKPTKSKEFENFVLRCYTRRSYSIHEDEMNDFIYDFLNELNKYNKRNTNK